MVLETNKSATVISNISIAVTKRPALIDQTGSVFLIVPNFVFVHEPIHLTVLIQNGSPDVDVTVNYTNEAGTRFTRAVETATNTTIREIVESNRYRNRCSIANRTSPHSSNIDETATVFSRRLEAVRTVTRVGEYGVWVTVSRAGPEIVRHFDRFTLSAVVAVRQRPTLARELGTVLIVTRKPSCFVDEALEFLYAVQRPHAELEYRLDFGDGVQSSITSSNSTSRLPAWVTNGSEMKSSRYLGKVETFLLTKFNQI